MLNFDQRTGPDFGDCAPNYPEAGVPDWFKAAKLGFFVHWGLYSVPAWAETGEAVVALEDAYRHHRYAEWYGNTVRIPGSPARRRHEELYGVGTSYEDFADQWQISESALHSLVEAIADAGARYLVPTAKHHDGFCLWDTATTTFNTQRRGPKKDLMSLFEKAARAHQMKFGVYFSGALDWHVSDFPAIQSDRELFLFRRNDEEFSRYAAAQLEELISRLQPDLLWNDIDWPDGGKGFEDYALAALFQRYLRRVPEGALNDRWGIPFHGFVTREYSHIPKKLPYSWEATRGLGLSFGYNQDEGDEVTMSGQDLIRLLIDVVAKNGNLLINVGPRADGTIPEIQAQAMYELGQWLGQFGEGIYGTRPWEEGVYGSQRIVENDGAIYVYGLDGEATLPEKLRGKSCQWLSKGDIAIGYLVH